MARPRMPRPRILAFTTSAVVVVALLGWMIGSWLGLSGWWLWGVRAGVWILGMALVALVTRIWASRDSGGSSKEPDLIDQLLVEARKRLAGAGVRARGILRRAPVVLVAGPKGSAKTTLVTRSRLDAEHLAGNLGSDGDLVAPTEALNVWFHEDRLIVEAAGQIAVEPSRWSKLVSHIQPRKWLPALLGRPQAPRVAVVCFSVEDLLRGGTADEALAAARNLRDRLVEVSESIGIRLPVYVVFTKTDAVAHFHEYVGNFTMDEVDELLGATLRALPDAAAGTWAERETSRLEAAFQSLFHSLAERRLEVLSRSEAKEKNGAAYEFPREFRKLSGRAIEFLTELCRPSQLRVSPFLRGFYFTGVRPVVVTEEGAPRRAPEPAQAPPSSGATQVLDLEGMHEAARQRQPTSGREGRRTRVPQWVFLSRILGEAVLPDRVAMGITTTGFGLSVLRRLAMGAALALLLVLGVAAVLSWSADRSLQTDTREAIAAVRDLPDPGAGLADRAALERLDSLRSVTARLSAHEHEGRPWRRFLLMYTGDELYPLARRTWFDRFRTLLLERARADVERTLEELPDEPTLAEFDRSYEALKVYVEMTEAHEEAEPDFFGRVLTRHWAGASEPGEERRSLARVQFAFYGAELAHGDPYGLEPDRFLRDGARDYLVTHTDESSFYRALVTQWNRLDSVRLARARPETEPYLDASVAVAGAFTRPGWDSVHASLENAERALAREPHVVGEGFFESLRQRGLDPETLAPALGARYEGEYGGSWARFLAGVSFRPPPLSQAGDRLGDLGGNRSAILQTLALVTEHTRIEDAPELGSLFAPVHSFVAPDSLLSQKLFSDDPGAPYLERVRSLARAVGDWTPDPGNADAAAAMERAAADGRAFVQDLQVDFPSQPPVADTASTALADLLTAPFDWASGQAGRGGQYAANDLARSFCAEHSGVFDRYPFEPDAPPADWQELAAVFRPGDGELAGFLDEAEGFDVRLNSRYESFARWARGVANAFFASGEDAPGFRVQIRARVARPAFDQYRIDLSVDGDRGTFTSTQRNPVTFEWSAPRAEQVTLTVEADGQVVAEREWTGRWALFRFFHQGDWQSGGGRSHVVTWNLEGVEVSADVTLQGEPILDRDHLQGSSCPGRIVG